MKKLLLFLAVLLTTTTGFAADGGYLFVTFKGEDTPMTEQIYFGISKNGQNWEALNKAEPVLISALGDIDQPGTYDVTFKVTRKADGNIMNLRSITFTP